MWFPCFKKCLFAQFSFPLEETDFLLVTVKTRFRCRQNPPLNLTLGSLSLCLNFIASSEERERCKERKKGAGQALMPGGVGGGGKSGVIEFANEVCCQLYDKAHVSHFSYPLHFSPTTITPFSICLSPASYFSFIFPLLCMK